jgi:prepilin-type N-terminal cleavage/methylation domain-containing protein/prepilin-type processing-associated H-X9-DG protein
MKTNNIERRSHKGFTLIELLVVIAIIAILAAILFPVFAQAREKARQITCVSNQKQVLLSMIMYTEDNDEYYPVCWSAITGTFGGTAYNSQDWTVAIAPYTKSGSGILIGATNGPNGYNHDTPTLTTYGATYECPSNIEPDMAQTYVLRADVFPWGSPTTSPIPAITSPVCNESRIPTPSDTVMAYEAGANGYQWGQIAFNADEYAWCSTINAPVNGIADEADNAECDYLHGTTSSSNWMACYQVPRYRHTLMSNFMFFDGHVQSIRKGQLNWYKQIWIKGICDYTGSQPPSWNGCAWEDNPW